MLGALALLCVVLSVLSPNFLTAGNLRNVLWQVTAIGIIAIGQTFVILTGGIDLSVGGIAALSAMAGGLLMTSGGGENVAVGLIATLVVGLIIGTANGLLVSYGRLAPFIVTLGMLSITNSLTYVISDATSIVGLPDAYRFWGRGEIFGIPLYLITFVVLFVLGQIFLVPHQTGAIHLCHRQQRRSRAPFRRQCAHLQDAAVRDHRSPLRDCRAHSLRQARSH